MQTKIAIFDLDGVIIEEDIKPFFGSIAYGLETVFGKMQMPKEHLHFETDTDAVLTLARYNDIPKQRVLSEIHRIHRNSSKFVEDRIDSVDLPIIKGIKYVIDEAKKAGYILCIATGNTRLKALLKLNKVGLLENFDVITSSDPDITRKYKVLEKALKEVREKWKIKRISHKNVFYIGDSESDMKASEMLGINFIGIETVIRNVETHTHL